MCETIDMCIDTEPVGIECDDKKFSNRTEHTTDNDLKCFFCRGRSSTLDLEKWWMQ